MDTLWTPDFHISNHPSDHPYDITLSMYYAPVSGQGTPTLGEVRPKNFPRKIPSIFSGD